MILEFFSCRRILSVTLTSFGFRKENLYNITQRKTGKTRSLRFACELQVKVLHACYLQCLLQVISTATLAYSCEGLVCLETVFLQCLCLQIILVSDAGLITCSFACRKFTCSSHASYVRLASALLSKCLSVTGKITFIAQIFFPADSLKN